MKEALNTFQKQLQEKENGLQTMKVSLLFFRHVQTKHIHLTRIKILVLFL